MKKPRDTIDTISTVTPNCGMTRKKLGRLPCGSAVRVTLSKYAHPHWEILRDPSDARGATKTEGFQAQAYMTGILDGLKSMRSTLPPFPY